MDDARFYKQIDVPRALWDPTEVKRHSRYGERPFHLITGVEVHWVGSGAVGDHGDTAEELLGFERFHEQTKGWYDLFYQVGIDSEGYTYEGRNATIQSQSDLRNWLTVLFVLGEEDDPPPVRMYQRLYDIWGAVDPRRKPGSIRYHGERSATSCPGPDIKIGVELLRAGWNPYNTIGEENMELDDLPKKPLPETLDAEYKNVSRDISTGTNPGDLAARWEAIITSNRAYVESKKYTDEEIKKAIAKIDPQVEVDIDEIVDQVTAKVLRALDGQELVATQKTTFVLDI